MLATDLHNPSVKVKMTKEQWINRQAHFHIFNILTTSQRKMNDGKDFEEQFLIGIYDRIAAQEIRLQDTPLTVDNELSTGMVLLELMLTRKLRSEAEKRPFPRGDGKDNI
jgi:Sec7-like guanine-nucleotide exchange factor